MGGTYTMSYTPSTGDTITAARWITANSEHIAGNDFTGLGDYSASSAEMQTTADPYPSQVESLPTNGKGELEILRYLIGQLGGRVNQSGYWYQDPLISHVCDGRLTLTSATPVTTGDVTAATTIYYTPYKGSRLSLYDGSFWNLYTLTQISIAVPATTSTAYDVFVYDNSGTLTLELTAWTNRTTRATALVFQNGVYVKTGATTRRYLGTFSTTAVSGQTEDSKAKRFVWNYYNRVAKNMVATESTNSWQYTLGTYEQANATASNQLEMMVGVSEDMVRAEVMAETSNSTNGISANVGIGLDSTTTDSSTIRMESTASVAGERFTTIAIYSGFPTAGYNNLVWLERSTATGTATWYGDNGSSTVQSGIFGVLSC